MRVGGENEVYKDGRKGGEGEKSGRERYEGWKGGGWEKEGGR